MFPSPFNIYNDEQFLELMAQVEVFLAQAEEEEKGAAARFAGRTWQEQSGSELNQNPKDLYSEFQWGNPNSLPQANTGRQPIDQIAQNKESWNSVFKFLLSHEVAQKYITARIQKDSEENLSLMLANFCSKKDLSSISLSDNEINKLQQQTILRLGTKLDFRTPPTYLLQFICAELQFSQEDFKKLCTSFISHLYDIKVLPRLTQLPPPKPFDELSLSSDMPHFNEKTAYIDKMLLFIASCSSWDGALLGSSPSHSIVQSDGEISFAPSLDKFEEIYWEILKDLLQAHLCMILKELRLEGKDAGQKQSQRNALYTLIELNQLNVSTEDALLQSLGELFSVDSVCVKESIDVLKWIDIENNILEEELSPFCPGLITARLRNLGSTCYMNAVLQMVANTEIFDQFLGGEIHFQSPYRRTNEDELQYQLRVEQERAKFEDFFPKKIALQSHLRSIIAFMRINNGSEVSRLDMKVLFKLLQLNGWEHSPLSQQDPQEFFIFLQQALSSVISTLQVIERYTYQKDEGQTSFQTKAFLGSVALPLPMGNPREFDLKRFPTLEDLLYNFRHETITGDNAYIPPGESAKYDLEKVVYFVGKPPKNLFIQLNRFGYDKEPFRISGQVPISQSITVPFYEEGKLDQPKEAVYEVKVIIQHHPLAGGEVFSPNSGHYTARIQQQDPISGEKNLIHYDDHHPIQKLPCQSIPLGELQDLQEKAYFLAFELIDNENSLKGWQISDGQTEMPHNESLNVSGNQVAPGSLLKKRDQDQVSLILPQAKRTPFPSPIEKGFIAWPDTLKIHPVFKEFLEIITEVDLLDKILMTTSTREGYVEQLRSLLINLRICSESISQKEIENLETALINQGFNFSVSGNELFMDVAKGLGLFN